MYIVNLYKFRTCNDNDSCMIKITLNKIEKKQGATPWYTDEPRVSLVIVKYKWGRVSAHRATPKIGHLGAAILARWLCTCVHEF